MGVLSKASAAAAKSGSIKALRAALEISANINDRDENAETLLMIAASSGHIASCMLLFDMGADLTLVDRFNRTALDRADAEGHADLVKWFNAVNEPTKNESAKIPTPPPTQHPLALPERRPVAPPTERQSQLKQLIALGKEQGYLTYSQVNDYLPPEIVDPEQIEEIVNAINDMGMLVCEMAPEESLLAPETIVPSDEEAIAEAEAALAALNADAISCAPDFDEIVSEALDCLTQEEREIIRLLYTHYIEGTTKEEIANLYGISVERVNEIEQSAFRKLQEQKSKRA